MRVKRARRLYLIRLAQEKKRQDVVRNKKYPISENIKKKICSKRKNRRRSLFQLKRIGKGGAGPKIRLRTMESSVRC